MTKHHPDRKRERRCRTCFVSPLDILGYHNSNTALQFLSIVLLYGFFSCDCWPVESQRCDQDEPCGSAFLLHSITKLSFFVCVCVCVVSSSADEKDHGQVHGSDKALSQQSTERESGWEGGEKKSGVW